jgi:hypothetical protein
MKTLRITAEEFRKEFARYLTLAKHEVVTIVCEGQEQVVLLSAQQYAELQPNDPIAMPIDALTEQELNELERTPIPEETRELNHLLPKDWSGK